MNKKLAWLLWLPLSVVSPLALAVGLGQATVNSTLQAPLDASVPLVNASDVVLDDVRVEIADASAFRALGLEWSPLAASVRTELQRLPSGAQLVLRSDQAVNEPWLDLLVTLITPEGRRTEALTLLFDPPNYTASTASAAGASSAVSSAPSSAPPSVAASRPSSAARDIAYVASGDTLWGVAARIKPADVSVQQMMVALVDANPTAFPTGNVDDMRAGQTLNVPSREQLMARSPAQAAQAIQSMRQSSSEPSTVPPSNNAPASQPSAETASEVAASSAPNTGSPDSAPVATVQEGELAGLTLNDLAEQLLESQAMLQTLLDEREAMRAEMAALRQEVASLTEALSASQQETRRALAAAEARGAEPSSPDIQAVSSPVAADTPAGASASPSIIERMEQYQWPLASVALALLLGALIWSRKRRERQWEDAPAPMGINADVTPSKRTEPGMASSANAAPMASSVPPEASLYTPPRTDSAVPSSHAGSAASEETGGPDERVATDDDGPGHHTGERAPDHLEHGDFEPQPREPSDHEPLYREPSYPETSDDETITVDERDELRYAADQYDDAPLTAVSEEDEAALEAAFLDTPEPVDQMSSGAPMQASMQESGEPPLQDEDRAHYIDYHPPSLTREASGGEEGADDQAGARSSQESRVAQPPRVPEEEWDIEEVAFEPRRRDNG
ncbi:type IV pilus assembly protein FimV [Vreelandella piezotolerans]|uniref:LysM domain-containing protein n=1 Tax=Vreelandella piezotolerans TaxID=2609667 RepID=A0ABQ6X5J2_9GAMM|nr:FimV/HubP family polar landmark protein [Halomonas piezotolerans]KAE8437295.1 hypothetical protein F1978_15705 [Halomonas piezotolerans]QJA23980.1 hypothetical protein GYM47_07595 [Halomonas piezotolerans]